MFCRETTKEILGKLVSDIIVDGRVIADPKVVTAFNETHIAQMLGYLNITGLDLALLLNFKEATLTWKRMVSGDRQDNHGSKRETENPCHPCHPW